MSYAIRRLGDADVAAYRKIRFEALSRHPEAYASSPESFAQRSDGELAALLGRMSFYGAFAEAGLGGILAYARADGERERHRGWIYQVYVQPALRGTGCAMGLLEAALDEARGEVLQVHLGVGAHNRPAIRLYERAGFEIYGTEPRSLNVNGRYVDEHLMVRFLDKAPGEVQ
ncbi:hypothetical protein GCM10011321_35380 [Youhaiella tibetensis]|uniref:GNAT family N-acetyltransferase n=1 Tax=Paradevosia tibetensis TaxID=1447062 RepID=UPI00147904F8|nr:GNAT family N-acetyltransferase [Youhaiella tibetensis]GGF41705.1 hypothetical protein GCM10011321_35380 [Youhaiella tibetensis]